MQIGASARQILQRASAAIAANAIPTLTPAQIAARQMPLAEFVRAAWPIIEPSTPLTWAWPVQAIADHLQALLEGRLARRNLAILVPPGFAKSTIVSVCAPAWQWIRRPQWRGIFASGNPAVAVRDSMRCRSVIESPWYRQTFGIPWQLADDENLKTRYANSARGFRVALSASARVTGDRADALFIDDPLDAADAHSRAARDAVNQWYDMAFANRLNDLRTGTRVLIQQRLHVDDLAGHVLAVAGGEWETLLIPQEWDESFRQTSSIGWSDPRTEPGQLAFPERFPASVVTGERVRLGRSGYSGQHLQMPTAPGGELFKADCLQLWPASEPLPQFSRIVQSWDTAFSTKSDADYSVGFTLGQFDRGVMILDRVRARLSFPALKLAALTMAASHPPTALLIEAKASGQSLAQVLQHETALPIVPVNVGTDKISRAHACVPAWESGRVFALANLPWLGELLDELTAFPKAPHDDQTDALTHGLIYLMQQPDGAGIMDYYDRLAREAEAAAVAPEAQPTDVPPWRRADAQAGDLAPGLRLSGGGGLLK